MEQLDLDSKNNINIIYNNNTYNYNIANIANLTSSPGNNWKNNNSNNVTQNNQFIFTNNGIYNNKKNQYY